MINFNQKRWIKCRCQVAQLVLLLGFTTLLHATTREEGVKAGIVYNFTKFTVWPESNVKGSYFNLCIFGNKYQDGFDALSGKLVLGKPMLIARNPKDTDIPNCQIVYIKKTSLINIQKILKKCHSLPILTVSDSQDFIHQGGMVGLNKYEKNIGFEANVNTIHSAGISIGAQLLKLAKRVVGLN
ncbi:MAG: YfiR family protein [Methylophilaceae bacterium]